MTTAAESFTRPAGQGGVCQMGAEIAQADGSEGVQ